MSTLTTTETYIMYMSTLTTDFFTPPKNSNNKQTQKRKKTLFTRPHKNCRFSLYPCPPPFPCPNCETMKWILFTWHEIQQNHRVTYLHWPFICPTIEMINQKLTGSHKILQVINQQAAKHSSNQSHMSNQPNKSHTLTQTQTYTPTHTHMHAHTRTHTHCSNLVGSTTSSHDHDVFCVKGLLQKTQIAYTCKFN